MKKGIMLFILILTLVCAGVLWAAQLVTTYEYKGRIPYIATGAKTVEKETGRMFREAKLKEIKAKKRLLIIDEYRYVYLASKDGVTKKEYHYEVERKMPWGAVVREKAYYLVPEPGEYETVYNYEDTLPPFLPGSAITKKVSSGEIVGKSRLVNIVPKEENQGWLEIEETHYTKGKIVFRSLVRRGVVMGMIIDEKPAVGQRLTDYNAWWPTDRWPCMPSRF